MEKLDLGRRRHTFLELDATTQTVEVVRARHARHESRVVLVHVVGRVEKLLADVAVGGKEEEARRVTVESSHGKEPGIAVGGDELGDAGPSHGVAHGREVARRLVEHEVDAALRDRAHGAVDGHHVHVRVDLAAELGHDLTVDANAPGGHETLGTAPARDARPGEKALKPHGIEDLVLTHPRRLPPFRRVRRRRSHPQGARARRPCPQPSPRACSRTSVPRAALE